MDAPRAERWQRSWDLQILRDPVRTDPQSPCHRIDSAASSWRELPLPRSDIGQESLLEVLAARRSRRSFSDIDVESLATLLWYCQRRTMRHSVSSDVCKCPIPTAGGIASVRTIVVSDKEMPWMYDAYRHRRGILSVSPYRWKAVLDDVENFMPIGGGSLLLFVAFREYVEHYYENPESLVLREAGVLTGVMSLVSEVLDLAFCALGTQGHSWSASILGADPGQLIPGGAALVGAR